MTILMQEYNVRSSFFSIESKCLDSILDARRKAVGLGDNPFK